MLRTIAVIAALLVTIAVDARADDDFFTIRQPGHLSLTVFGSGFGSDTYGTTHAGLQLEQTITNYVSAVGRVTAYQVYKGEGYDSPFVTESTGFRTFERFQGGIDIAPIQGISLTVLGGHDVGNANKAVIEGDFTSWLFMHSHHPVNFSFSSTHYYENGVTSTRIDLRQILYSSGKWIFLAGGGGAFWGGGQEGKPNGQGGPDLGVFLRDWHTSIDLQSGYGSSHLYGLVSVTKSFGWDE
ncbi:MAG TPA: hypothetical protein VMM16_06700 [Verrucomicrobiae bacterium]|nr:hypothetical protein [Verrucomicrobiae bacterium]